jgi:hypothetical protein
MDALLSLHVLEPMPFDDPRLVLSQRRCDAALPDSLQVVDAPVQLLEGEICGFPIPLSFLLLLGPIAP